jgi:hypothetical protein
VVKDGREVWTEGPGDRVTSRGGTSTSASVYESDHVDRVKTADVRVERGSEGLGGLPVKDGGDTCRVAENVYGVRYSRAV